MKTFKAGSLEKLVEHLVLAFLKGNFSYIRIFLGTYRTYATTQQVLDQLLQRYGCNHPYSAQDAEPQDQLKGSRAKARASCKSSSRSIFAPRTGSCTMFCGTFCSCTGTGAP
nr:ral guanine nucleotide dissociation stimulator-like isoform X3 [Loxodonta africana]